MIFDSIIEKQFCHPYNSRDRLHLPLNHVLSKTVIFGQS